MRVDPDFRRGVVYICDGYKTPEPVGTGFLVGLIAGSLAEAEAHNDDPPLYVVTARHVLEGASLPSIRINLAGGGVQEITAPREEWNDHPNADCSIFRIGKVAGMEVGFLPETLFTNEAEAREQEVLGEQVFFVGLFSKSPGAERNEPIVRFGNLVAPEAVEVTFKPQPKSRLFTMKAYLVEAHSWGGHSGSPAFLLYSHRLDPPGGRLIRTEQRLVLLGTVSGHYEEAANLMGDTFNKATPEEERQVAANLGIAVVVPADRIAELLDAARRREFPAVPASK